MWYNKKEYIVFWIGRPRWTVEPWRTSANSAESPRHPRLCHPKRDALKSRGDVDFEAEKCKEKEGEILV